MCMFICTYTWPKKISSVSGVISEIGILNIRRSFPAILTLQIYHHQSGIGGILTDVWQHKPSRRGDDDSQKLYVTDSTEQCLRMCFPDWVLHDLVVKIPFGLSGQFIKLFPSCYREFVSNLCTSAHHIGLLPALFWKLPTGIGICFFCSGNLTGTNFPCILLHDCCWIQISCHLIFDGCFTRMRFDLTLVPKVSI